MKCPKCHRTHSGICGIPASVTLGFGARTSRTARDAPVVTQGKPWRKQPDTSVLEGLLTGAREHLTDVMEMLKTMPLEMPEYTDLLDRESKLNNLVHQILGQIAARKGAK